MVDAEGAALADWTVTARLPRANPRFLSTSSDASGRFELTGCDGDGEYVVDVRHPKMSRPALTRADVRVDEPPLTLVVPREDVPSCFVTGRLVDARGVELDSARLSV